MAFQTLLKKHTFLKQDDLPVKKAILPIPKIPNDLLKLIREKALYL